MLSRINFTNRYVTLLSALAILFSATTLRLLTYDRYLPFLDYSDEAVYIALADEKRGFSDQTALREQYGTLAPLYVEMNVLVHTLHDALKTTPWHLPGEYFYSMRLLSALFGVCTVVAIGAIGWQLAGRGAALLGALIWALSPIVINFNNLALPDPPLYFVCAFAVASAVASVRRSSIAWLFVSLLSGIAAIYLKLWIVTVVFPFMIASVLLVIRDRRRMLPRVALLYGVAALFAFHFLFVINPFSSTSKISDNLTSGSLLTNLFEFRRLINNLWHISYVIDGGTWLAVFLVVSGLFAYLYSQRAGLTTPDARLAWIVGLYTLATWWLSTGISNVDLGTAGRMRHVFPAVVAFIPLWSTSIVQIARVLEYRLTRNGHKGRRIARLSLIATGSLFLIASMGSNLQLIAQYQRPHTVNQTVSWFDSSPPRDGLVLMTSESSYSVMWNRWWGAYMGSKPYEWWVVPINEITRTTPEAYVVRGIHWLVLTDGDLERADDPARLDAYLGALLPVKDIAPAINEVEGQGIHVYRFEMPDQRADFGFGGQLRLIGYDLGDTVLQSGETIRFRPYWRLDAQTTQNLSMFVHLYSADSAASGSPVVLAQWDGEPLTNGNRPTSTWGDLQEVYFGERIQLTIPENVSAGEYLLAVGLYDYLTQQRLMSEDSESYYSIPVTIE